MADAYNEYFSNQEKYTKIYGKLSLFIMQVGSFFEAYQTIDEGYDLQLISNILNISVTKKNKSIISIDRKNPYMLGFPCVALQKYIKILIDNGYTIIVMEQVSPAPKPRREITGIYSPSTYINEISKPDSNFLLTIFLEEINSNKKNKIYMAGLSLIEASTGYIKIHETFSSKDDEKISLDEIVKFINSFSPTEILLVSNNIQTNINEIILYLELHDKKFIHKTLNDIKNMKGYNNFQNISYQSTLLKKIYKINTCPIDYLNLETYTLGRDAFILSLLYLSDHNSNLLTNLSKPEIYIKEDKMHLGNNPIYQLDVFAKDDKTLFSIENSYKCLFDIINKTLTPMGRRYLKNVLIEPLINCKIINFKYDIIENLQKTYNTFEQVLSEIKDVERLDRKINLKNINPIEFYQWILFQENALKLVNLIYSDKILTNLLNNVESVKIAILKKKLENLIKYLNETFEIDQLEKYLLNDITGNIFIKGKYVEIDELQNSIEICTNFMHKLAEFFDSILKDKTNKKSDDQFIKIDSNDRDGYYLILSNKRAEVLQTELKKSDKISITIGSKIINIKTSSINFIKPVKGSNTKVFCNEIKQKSDKINEYMDEIKIMLKEKFIEELSKLSDMYEINIITNFIGHFDFLLSGAKVANKFYYNKPIINNKYDKKSYFIAKDLRHPIVERINTDIEFIPTDIELGTEKQDGILLFGLNSAGKSTLQKAIGLSVLLAQIGYFVPASNFEYYPYNSMLTRISSNDNLFKGLSAFTLEVSELTAILKRNSRNTLIIADEICKGTEHHSSLIIVMTIIKMLSESQTSFITATHLHDICNFKELSQLKNISKYYLHVEYDEKNNKLIYDRKLHEGSGSNFYGLLVAKCLINDKTFTDYSNIISKDLKVSDISSDKKSRYNNKLYVQKCQICNKIPLENEIPLETHHINFQKDCDNNGLINNKKYIHKNHMSNLTILCHKCHDKIDTGLLKIDGYKETSNGQELNYKNLLEIDNKLNKKIEKTLKKIKN